MQYKTDLKSSEIAILDAPIDIRETYMRHTRDILALQSRYGGDVRTDEKAKGEADRP
jgi:hypothetical protein